MDESKQIARVIEQGWFFADLHHRLGGRAWLRRPYNGTRWEGAFSAGVRIRNLQHERGGKQLTVDTELADKVIRAIRAANV